MKYTTEQVREEWWFPQLTDGAWIARIRSDYPEETERFDDEDIREEYANGWKYADTWDNLRDARNAYEKLADAYLELLKSASQPAERGEAVGEVVAQDTAVNGNARGIRHLYPVNTKDDLLPVGTKLYTAPPPAVIAQNAEDAKRFKALMQAMDGIRSEWVPDVPPILSEIVTRADELMRKWSK